MPRQHAHDFNVGGNINEGLRASRQSGCEIILLNLDDFGLIEPLDIRPMVDLLDSYNEVGLIRLSYWVRGLSGVCVSYVLPRLNSKDYLWIRLIREWTLDNPWQTDDYLYSMQPHIAHMRYFEAYGYYAEHLHPGDTETEAWKAIRPRAISTPGTETIGLS